MHLKNEKEEKNLLNTNREFLCFSQIYEKRDVLYLCKRTLDMAGTGILTKRRFVREESL